MKRFDERKEDFSKVLTKLKEALKEPETELNADGVYTDLNLLLN